MKGSYSQIWYVPGFPASLDSVRAFKSPMDILHPPFTFQIFFSGLPFVCPKYYTCHRYLHQQTMTTDCFQQLSLGQSCSTVSEFGLESNKDYVEVLPGKSSKPKQHGQLSPLQLCTDTSLARLLAFQIPTDLGEGSRSEVG